ncbi:MAG: hypothetical protein GF308_14055 [Candidatus Heimdallarchaeota archaeon]|nr:hypothetical protein [Candidatus Heimdallarchaeota archaeon]
MKFVALNGSPKGSKSTTFYCYQYIKKYFPNYNYREYHIARKIKKIEKNQELFNEIIREIASADGIIWLFPVYLLHVPAQLIRFIELLFKEKEKIRLAEKYATSFSTSFNFYDHIAHQYIQAISEDLGMNYIKGYSATMNDLFSKEERKRFRLFAKLFFTNCEEQFLPEKVTIPIKKNNFQYSPEKIESVPKRFNYRIILVTDTKESDHSLEQMIQVFSQIIPNELEIININNLSIKGGCLGCLKCTADNICFYTDDIMATYQEKIIPADSVIYAFSIKNRSFSSRMKMFIDRSFFNGHRPVFKGQQNAYLISGPISQTTTLRESLEGSQDVGKVHLVGIVSDGSQDSNLITKKLRSLAHNIIWGLGHNKFTRHQTFRGKGGHKIFQDLIQSYQTILRQDYLYYKKNNLFDKPKNFFGPSSLILNPLMRIDRFRKWFLAKAGDHIENRFKEILEKTE